MENSNEINYKYIVVTVVASGLMSIAVALALDYLQRKREDKRLNEE